MRTLGLMLAGACLAAGVPALAADSAYGDVRPPATVQAQIDRLLPQRPGVVDLYAVLVGADGDDGVYAKEIATVDRALDERLGTAGRVVTLVNKRSSSAPEATLNSLAYVLKSIAAKMDPAEDVLLLHIATTGAPGHVLQFRHPQRKLFGLAPKYFQSLLAKTRIRFRFVSVSACYSGGVVAALANSDTLAVSATSANSAAGCANDGEITNFSRALYVSALKQTRWLPGTARLAMQILQERESNMQRERSYPQLQSGVGIEERLRLFERQIAESSRRMN
jgi:hypothetical protein